MFSPDKRRCLCMSKSPNSSLARRGWLLAVALLCVFALVGCQTGGAGNSPTQGSQSTAQAADANSVLAGFPLFPQMKELADPVPFEWKNLSTAYAVPDSYWAYYLVPAPFLEVAAFYRAEAISSPFVNSEIYWKETAGGVLSAYFQKDADTVYSRIWFIPHPGNDQESYLIIMRNNDIGGCSIF